MAPARQAVAAMAANNVPFSGDQITRLEIGHMGTHLRDRRRLIWPFSLFGWEVFMK